MHRLHLPNKITIFLIFPLLLQVVFLITPFKIVVFLAALIFGQASFTDLRILNSHQAIIFTARNLDKDKKAAVISSIILLILNYHIFFINFQFLSTVILWVALIFSIVSGIDYFIKSWSVVDTET